MRTRAKGLERGPARAAFTWRRVAALETARTSPRVVALTDGRALVAGGSTSGPDYRWITPIAVEVWDPRAEAWSRADDLVDGRGRLVGVKGVVWDGTDWREVDRIPPAPVPSELELPDGSVLKAGIRANARSRSRDGLRAVRLRPRRGRPAPRSMRHPRIAPQLTLLPGDRVLVSGGYEISMDFSWETDTHPIRSAEVVDLRTGAVGPAGRLAVPRMDHAAVLLRDGTVLVVGGFRSKPVADVELGTPAR